MTRLRASLLGVPLVATACTPSVTDGGIGEPIVVESAQFIAGTLPGLPPPDASVDAGADTGPAVTDISVANLAIFPGEEGLMMTGHTTTNAQSVAVRFADLGTGFWVVPVGAPDPTDEGLLSWQLTADFSQTVPPGYHNLLFAAVSASGASGIEYALPFCMDTPVPDNLNVCAPTNPKIAPPPAVLSLAWDNPVDLNIIVQTPSGAVVGASTAATSTPTIDGGVAPATSGSDAGIVLDHESNRNCVIDNIDRDDLVWTSAPEPGTYLVWVDLFRSCGQSSVSFTVTLWLAEPNGGDGTQSLVEETPPVATGELTSLQANGGSGYGLYVGSFVIN
jgi:hypothetical protein